MTKICIQRKKGRRILIFFSDNAMEDEEEATEKHKERESRKRSASSENDKTPAKKSKDNVIDMIKNKLECLNENMPAVNKKLH